MILSSAIEDHSSEEQQRSSSSCEMPVTPHIKPGKKRRRGSEVDDVILENLRQLQERREIRAQQRQNLDEEDNFACQIAAVLRRLPIQKRSLAKIKIQQALYEFEFSEKSPLFTEKHSAPPDI